MREKVLQALAKLGEVYPQQRLGQLLYNYVLCKCPNNDPFYIEDIDFYNYILEEIEEFEKKSIDN